MSHTLEYHPMAYWNYLLIGGGMASAAAAQAISQHQPSSSIAILTAEPHPPYKRPPLSKALWKGASLDELWFTFDSSVQVQTSCRAVELNPEAHTVLDEHGEIHHYEKLFLATGGEPRKPWGEGIIYFRTLDDYEHLRSIANRGGRVLVIGGGFIGSEIAAALAINGVAVTMLFPEVGIGARMFPAGLSDFLTAQYRARGVAIYPGHSITHLERHGNLWRAYTNNGLTLDADAVVAGVGIDPATALAVSAGLAVDNGIVVDEYLRTSHPDVYAAGDVVNFYCSPLGERIRVEHEDNALTQGAIAGENMTGSARRYEYLPMFYSDLFEFGYEAVGLLDSRLEMVEDWREPYREGVVYYCREGIVRGVLLWNVWERVEAARQLIAGRERAAAGAIEW